MCTYSVHVGGFAFAGLAVVALAVVPASSSDAVCGGGNGPPVRPCTEVQRGGLARARSKVEATQLIESAGPVVVNVACECSVGAEGECWRCREGRARRPYSAGTRGMQSS